MLWCIVNTLLRVSISLNLLAMFGRAPRRRFIYLALLALSILYGLAAFLEVIFICQPLSAAWNPNVNCENEVLAYVVLESIGLLIDLAFILAPFEVPWMVRLRLRQKLLLSIPFSIGGL